MTKIQGSTSMCFLISIHYSSGRNSKFAEADLKKLEGKVTSVLTLQLTELNIASLPTSAFFGAAIPATPIPPKRTGHAVQALERTRNRAEQLGRILRQEVSQGNCPNVSLAITFDGDPFYCSGDDPDRQSACVNMRCRNAFFLAITKDSCVREIFQGMSRHQEPVPQCEGVEALSQAVGHQNLPLVQYLLREAGPLIPSCDELQEDPLAAAVKTGNREIVETLLEAGFNNTCACRFGLEKSTNAWVHCRLQASGSPDAFSYMDKNGDEEMRKLLLDNGVDERRVPLRGNWF